MKSSTNATVVLTAAVLILITLSILLAKQPAIPPVEPPATLPVKLIIQVNEERVFIDEYKMPLRNKAVEIYVTDSCVYWNDQVITTDTTVVNSLHKFLHL